MPRCMALCIVCVQRLTAFRAATMVVSRSMNSLLMLRKCNMPSVERPLLSRTKARANMQRDKLRAADTRAHKRTHAGQPKGAQLVCLLGQGCGIRQDA